MLFLMPNEQCQSTEGNYFTATKTAKNQKGDISFAAHSSRWESVRDATSDWRMGPITDWHYKELSSVMLVSSQDLEQM